MKKILIFLTLLTVQQSYAGVKLGNKKALLIGISKYQKSTGWRDIYCNADIIYINKSLIKSGFVSSDIKILEDSMATKSGIISSIVSLIKTVNKGDIVFIHYSGHGQQIYDDNGDEKDGFDECLVPCDAPLYYSDKYKGENHIRDDELIKLLNKIREKLGPNGQLIFTADACHSGPDNDGENYSDTSNGKKIIIGRGGIFEDFKTQNNKDFSSVIIMTSTINTEVTYETIDTAGKSVGAFSYAIYQSLTQKKYSDYKDYSALFDSIRLKMSRTAKRQHPTIAGYISEKVFSSTINNSKEKPKSKSKCYVISIGINNYKSSPPINLKYENCYNDAILFSQFCERSFKRNINDSNTFFKSLMLNEKASSKEIIEALNKAISMAKPEDYFIFSFAGMTNTLYDSSGNKVTYFYTSDINNISDTNEVKKKAISLEKLKNLLDLIAANNQMLITEAGSTENFQREFIKILIESSPEISNISKRNRIIIVPRDFGRDDFYCNDKHIQSGPINYFITNLDATYNFFNLFEHSNKRNAVEKAIFKNELECNFSDVLYTQIFYEREFVENLQYYMPENSIKSRGGHTINNNKKVIKSKISEKHALIIGTNLYKAKPQWDDLSNPELDALVIAEELKNSYGFNTKLLLNPSQDSVYAALFKYSKTLDSNDQLIIFFAGHGDFDAKYFDDGFIVLHNSIITKTDPYRKSYIKHTELERMINKLPPKQILVILDVCFGGTFDKRILKQESRSKNEMYDDLETSEFVNNKLKFNTRIYITSGGKKEVPDGYKGKHSPFALKLLEALRTQGGNNGYLTATDIHAFVQKLPSGPLMGQFGDHQFGGEFMLIPIKD